MVTKKKKPATRWYNGITPIEELAANEQLAHEMVSRHRDLLPSVERIMASDLTDDQRTHALTSFRDSLTRIGDPNRDPRTAITNATNAP
jgi:hypothetical protein